MSRIERRRSLVLASAFLALAATSGLHAVHAQQAPHDLRRIGYLSQLALDSRLPAMCFVDSLVKAGCLMSYGQNLLELSRRGGDYVAKILKGANPADLPVEQPTKFDFVINAKTAEALGVTILPTVLLRADRVI